MATKSNTNIQQSPFVKQLAANDRPTRDKAVASLQSYLSTSRTFTKIDMLKLWKGLFYCMWHSDRPRPQQALASTLASLLLTIPAHNHIAFTNALWNTISREWTSIDALRMDKYLLLVRRSMGTSFRRLSAYSWDTESIQDLLNAMACALDPRVKIAGGLKLHLADVWVDELEKVWDTSPPSSSAGKGRVLELLMSPWVVVLEEGLQKSWKTRAKEVLEDERVRAWGYDWKGVEKAAERGEVWSGFDD